MVKNYINKIASKPEAFRFGKRDELQEWQKDLVFYWSCENDKADYALYDKTPTFKTKPEINADGKFGSYSKIKSPVVFSEKNLECLDNNINLSFWLGANSINGYYTIYIKIKEGIYFRSGDYSFGIRVDGQTTRQVTIPIDEGDDISIIRNKLSFIIDPSYEIEVDLDQSVGDILALKTKSPGSKFTIFDGTTDNNFLDFMDITDISYGTIPSRDSYYSIFMSQINVIENGTYNLVFHNEGELNYEKISLNLRREFNIKNVADEITKEIEKNTKITAEIDIHHTTKNMLVLKSTTPDKKLEITADKDGLNFFDIFEISNEEFKEEDTSSFDIVKVEGDTSSLKISHIAESEEGKLISKLKFSYISEGIEKITSIDWNNNGINLDHIEVDIDSSVMYIFINGNLEKAVLISPITRRQEPAKLTINGSEKNFYSIEELIIKSKLQNKENFIPPISQLTKYDNTIPYIDYYFNGKDIFQNSLVELKLNCSDRISMVLNYNGIYYYYNNGWRQSDGTFKNSTSSYIFSDYIKNFTFDGSDNIFVRAFFESDGDTEQFIEDIYFTVETDEIYGDENRTAAMLVGVPTFEPDQKYISPDEHYPDSPYPYDPSPDDIDPDDDSPIKPYPYDPSPDDINPEEGELIPQIIELEGKDLTIKTDLGTTKLIFPRNMTIDEAMNFIQDTYPEGIVSSYPDNKFRAVLLSETKGDAAFIKVEGLAADILFGDQKVAQGIDHEKNTLEDNYKDFIEMIKKYATNDLIPIEIDDEQIRMYLKEAINLYKKYRNDELNTYQVQLKGNEKDGYEIPPVVEDWHDITDILFRPLFPIGFYTGSFDNDAEDIVELSLVNAMGGVDYSSFYGKGFQTDYYISLMNISSMEQTLGLSPSWRVYNNRLYIFPNNISKYTTVTIVYKAPIDPVEALRDPYIIQYVYGKIRMAQAEVRGQYGSQLSTGSLAMTFNADAMYERGKEAVEKAIENMKGEQQPMGFIVG